MAPLLPKLRGRFAEFLDNASPAGLRILSSPTCVGLRYGRRRSDSGFSRQRGVGNFATSLRSPSRPGTGARTSLRACPRRLAGLSLSPDPLAFCVPAVLCGGGTGISACPPSATPLGLALGPGSPREVRLYPGNLGHPAYMVPHISRYSFRHSLFRSVHGRSRGRFVLADCSPTGPRRFRAAGPMASAPCFSPAHLRRGASRLVSCYALFQWVAASGPTS